MDGKKIVRDWLDDLSFTAALRDLDGHMDLVSRSVQVHGLPSGEVVDFEGWALRRRNEFNQGLLHSLTHRNVELREVDGDRIVFDVQETMKSTRGQAVVLNKEVMLKREQKRRWRVQFERIKDFKTKP